MAGEVVWNAAGDVDVEVGPWVLEPSLLDEGLANGAGGYAGGEEGDDEGGHVRGAAGLPGGLS